MLYDVTLHYIIHLSLSISHSLSLSIYIYICGGAPRNVMLC